MRETNCVLQLGILSFMFGLLNTIAEAEPLGNIDESQFAGIGGPISVGPKVEDMVDFRRNRWPDFGRA